MTRTAPVVLVTGGNRGIGEWVARTALDDSRTGVFLRDGQEIPW